MKVNVSIAEGLLLDGLVAMCQGYKFSSDGISKLVEKDNKLTILGHSKTGQGIKCGYSPSTDWAQGGPIIDMEKLMVQPYLQDGDWKGEWRSVGLSWAGRTHTDVKGPTALIAAMRCYVASVLGDEVEVPLELA